VVLLAWALLDRLASRGAPYFERPRSAIEHAGTGGPDIAGALIALPVFEKMIPRGADVTCFRPVDGQAHDDMNFLTAVGQLPRHRVLPPFTAGSALPKEELIEYVVAIREPFAHPHYTLVAALPEARLYRLSR
jgi:hypothetical protein